MDEEKKCPFEVGQTVKLTEEGRKLEVMAGVGEFVVTRIGTSACSDEWLVYGHDDGAFYSSYLELVALEPADYAGATEGRKLEDWPEAEAYREEIESAHEELIKSLRIQSKAALYESQMWEDQPNTQDARDASEAVCDTAHRTAKAATALIQVAMAAGEESQRWLLGATQSD